LRARALLPLILTEDPLLARPFLWKICKFDKDAISYIPDNVDQEGLGKDDGCPRIKIERCFHVVEVGSTIVYDSPRDAATVFRCKVRLDRHNVTQIHRCVDIPKPFIIVALRAE
jgi:hypothetical protein